LQTAYSIKGVTRKELAESLKEHRGKKERMKRKKVFPAYKDSTARTAAGPRKVMMGPGDSLKKGQVTGGERWLFALPVALGGLQLIA